MKFCELTFTVILKMNIRFEQSNEQIGKLINKAFLPDSELMQLHAVNRFKYYVFNSFYPIEPDGEYKAGRAYIFRLRTPDASLAAKLKSFIPKTENGLLTVLTVQSKTVKQSYVSNIYTMTPVVVTLKNNEYWTQKHDLMLLSKQLQDNLEKKHKGFYQGSEAIPESFIQRIELLNEKPIAMIYKNVKFIGNKFKIWVNEDETSQRLVFTAMACGLGEKNSAVGAGFCTGGQNR
jgi:CRISPR-associated endoribonuclease Cas6